MEGELEKTGKQIFGDSIFREKAIVHMLDDLHNEGYLLAQVKCRVTRSDTLDIIFQTGQKYKWIELKQGNVKEDILIKSGFDERIFKDKPLSYLKVLTLFESILSMLENNGFPFASIKLDSLYQEGQHISAALNYNSGPIITFDTLQLVGHNKTNVKYLSKFLQITPGVPFSQKKVDQAVARIQNLPYLRVNGTPEISFQNSEAILYLPVQERKINVFDGIIGLMPNEMETNKVLVTGQLDIALYNIGGKGRNFAASWQRLTPDSQNLRLIVDEPLVLGSNIDLKASFYLLKEDTFFLNRDFRIDLGYSISPTTYMSFFSRWQSGGLLAVDQYRNTETLPSIGDFKYNNYGIHFHLNHLDDVLYPRKGWFGYFEFGIGNKKILQNSGLPASVYESANQYAIQYFFNAKAEKHIYLYPKFGIMTALQAGQLESSNLFLNDLYRIGGLKSIRGFNENTFFANRYIYTNIEPRFYFDAYTYFMIFADIGNVSNKVSGVGGVDWPYAIGSGFNLTIDEGIFRFIYAVGQSDNQPLAFNYSKIHLGYTGRF